MQTIIDYITSHWAIVIVVVYELWSLIPSSVVASSSILTLIGNALKALQDKAQPPPAP